MAKSRLSTVIDQVIDGIEAELKQEEKHVIRLETVKRRSLVHIRIDCNNDDSTRCAEIGFDQVVHIRLYQYGYRSVRTGLFINLDSCDSVERLEALYESQDTTIKEKQKVLAKIKKKRDGQIGMQFDGAEVTGFRVPMTEEEFVADLEADAI